MAGTLLPDILSYDPTRPASFPSNGRTLTDDAADAFVAVLTNGKVTGDKVGPHIAQQCLDDNHEHGSLDAEKESPPTMGTFPKAA